MSNVSVFDFSGDHVKSKITYKLKLFRRMGESFEYVHDKLVSLGHHVSGDSPKVNNDICSEGKNYDWVAITSGNVKMLIRTYHMHFTVFTCVEDAKWLDRHYGAFTYNVNTKKMTKDDEVEGIPKPSEDEKYPDEYYSDYLFDDPFLMFNRQLDTILEIVRRGEVHTLWNTYSFERPKFVEVKNVYDGESITSFDELIFCGEELSCKHMQLFAETDMFEEIQKFKVGDRFIGDMHKGTITEVRTVVKDGYYHNTGLKIGDKWEDVYSLTRWDLTGVFSHGK